MKKWLLGFAAFSVVVALAIFVMSWNMKRQAVNTYNQYAAAAPYDVIIVPGLPYDTTQRNTLLKVRMFWAQSLYNKGLAKNIIFSGAAVHSPWVEGKVMKMLADSMGLPEAHTFFEEKAEHGNENIYYSCKLAQQLGFTKIAVATDQYQDFFLSRYIHNKMPNVARLPVSVDSFPVYNKRALPHINPHWAYVTAFKPLNERVGRLDRIRSSLNEEVGEK
jgi:uncharacterized SAM-binding protein YcdF (DUF218 family)